MTDEFAILTPEKVVLTFRFCGVASRVAAHLVDVLVAGTLAGLASSVVAVAAPVIGDQAALAVGSLASLATVLGYFVAFEYAWQGQTPGKKTARARVVMSDGTPVTFRAVLFRNLLRPADFLPVFYLLGVLCVFTNPRSQRLGDLAAGTVVVAERSPDEGYQPAPHHVGVHRFEEAVGNLERVSLEEYRMLKQLRDRFPTMPAEAQAWALATVWGPFAERHGIAPVDGVHQVYLLEAVIMKFGRLHNLI